jgi:hypothetical protein
LPDFAAIDMLVNPKPVPALSAISDMPVLENEPTPAAPAPQAAETETVPDKDSAPAAEREAEETESPAASETPDSESIAASEEPKKPARGVQKRLDELTSQREQERAEKLAAQAQLATALKTIESLSTRHAEPALPDPATRPQRDAFDSPEAFEGALIDYAGKQAATAAKAELSAQALQQAQMDAQKALHANWQAQRRAAEKMHPDFAQIVDSDALPISQAMAVSMMMSENGALVAYHLGKNPELAQRLAALPDAQAVFELGKLATEVLPKPQVSKAPHPIKPLGSRAPAADKSPEEETTDEYAARRNAQIRAQRKAG